MDEEIWKPVPSIPGIMASSWGRIIRLPHTKRGRTYRSNPTFGSVAQMSENYTRMIWRYRGIGTVKVHQAVCEAFHGPAPIGKPYVLHRDENSQNNVPGNVYWGTQRENMNAPGYIAHCQTRGYVYTRPKAGKD